MGRAAARAGEVALLQLEHRARVGCAGDDGVDDDEPGGPHHRLKQVHAGEGGLHDLDGPDPWKLEGPHRHRRVE